MVKAVAVLLLLIGRRLRAEIDMWPAERGIIFIDKSKSS
jgi:hypothetical protein